MTTPGALHLRYFYEIDDGPTRVERLLDRYVGDGFTAGRAVIWDRRTGERLGRVTIDTAELICRLLNDNDRQG